MSQSSPESFFDVWRTYRKVVDADYMFHKEIGADVRRALSARFEDRPVSLLDLGCGDASAVAPVLASIRLRYYKGVDLSETALTIAADNLKALSCPYELIHGDIMAALNEDAAAYDLIYTSFALHHLPTEQKAEFFRLAAQKLNANGCLLLVDVVREEDESLDVYYGLYCDWLRSSWTSLDAAEKDSVCDHLVNNDLPEPCSVLQAQARAAGLTQMSPVARYGWHRALSFARS